mmetsp:Transcript_8822/g.16175  ORF Transcript_8822/g.16175 Transcript_8822/m.16175 type:complete len:102 (-) Transcript_8822:189-494(-)
MVEEVVVMHPDRLGQSKVVEEIPEEIPEEAEEIPGKAEGVPGKAEEIPEESLKKQKRSLKKQKLQDNSFEIDWDVLFKRYRVRLRNGTRTKALARTIAWQH